MNIVAISMIHLIVYSLPVRPGALFLSPNATLIKTHLTHPKPPLAQCA
jgi:hypothetical protein